MIEEVPWEGDPVPGDVPAETGVAEGISPLDGSLD